MRKWDIVSLSLQNEQVLDILIFMLFSHSLHASILWVILYWNVCIVVCLEQMKDILKIVFQKLSSLFLNLTYIFSHDEIAFGKWENVLIKC